jgi:hypothetical protein
LASSCRARKHCRRLLLGSSIIVLQQHPAAGVFPAVGHQGVSHWAMQSTCRPLGIRHRARSVDPAWQRPPGKVLQPAMPKRRSDGRCQFHSLSTKAFHAATLSCRSSAALRPSKSRWI